MKRILLFVFIIGFYFGAWGQAPDNSPHGTATNVGIIRDNNQAVCG
jgi:hypothetical protein